MAAVVHHGGAGTAAAALCAGVPSIPVTGIMDQPFWSQRLHALGAATAPLSRVTLTTESLTGATASVVADRSYTRRAQQLSQLICAEDGEATATDIIAAHVEHHSTSSSGGN